MPRIVKNDASRQPFDEQKLRNSMLKALEKRPVSSEALDAAVVHICHKLRALGEREVPSRLVGELAMEELHHLDEVAYVRFASVYRSFQDVDAFREEIERMRHRRSSRESAGLSRERHARRSRATARTCRASKKRRRPHASEPAFTPFDHAHDARALELAALGRYTTHPNPRVGCVIAHGERIVGEGWHRKWGEPHAEAARAARAAGGARGATVYVTLEPHSLSRPHAAVYGCADRAGVKRVVCGMLDPNPQVAGTACEQLRAAGIEVDDRVAGSRSARAQSRFREAHASGRPRVIVKIARESRRPHRARERRESAGSPGEQRAPMCSGCARQSSAVLTGIGTVLADDPAVDACAIGESICRARQPLRVVLDSQLAYCRSARACSTSPARR